MTTPLPLSPVLMTALTELFRSTWAGRLPNVVAGDVFWASYSDSSGLIAGGMARPWQEGDAPAPPIEPPNTARGSAGFSAGAGNGSPGVSLPHYAGPAPKTRQN